MSDGTRQQYGPARRTTSGGFATIAMVSVVALGACGAEADSTEPTITDPTELVQGTALSYDSGTGEAEPQQIRAVLGQMVFLAVVSDVPGTVSIDDAGVTQPLRADEPGTLVFNAEEEGDFEVTLQGDGVDVLLAQVEVKK